MSDVARAASSTSTSSDSPNAPVIEETGPPTLVQSEEAKVTAGTSVVSILRSASSPHLPSLVAFEQESTSSEKNGIPRTFSANGLSTLTGIRQNASPTKGTNGIFGGSSPRKILRRRSTQPANEAKITIAKFTIAEEESGEFDHGVVKGQADGNKLDTEVRTRSVTSSLSNLARKPWSGTSRSPSPSRKRVIGVDLQLNHIAEKVEERFGVSEENVQIPEKTLFFDNSQTNALQKTDTVSSKRSLRPLSVLLGKSSSSSSNASPPVPSIPKSFSSDKLPSSQRGRVMVDQAPSSLRQGSSSRVGSSGSDTPRKRDELWNQFRTLDGEFQKFNSKTSTLKANMIRITLLPFLRSYSDHPSNKNLRIEDLDRRVNILNKWWTGLLEILNGRNGQSVSGNDRPTVLEGVTGIMMRPEWRLPASSISTRPEKTRLSLKSRSSSASLESTLSDFLLESVFHNIRNTFVQNLLSQMSFVVDRMSMRNIPASVVTFCGKATAYTFFFCPGVADILVRLWSISSDSVRRVMEEMNVSRTTNVEDVAERVSEPFPTHLRPLAFKSLPSIMRTLRSRSQDPFSTAYIPWNGPWVSRWAGKDSDLFFVFCRYYQVLACELLPDDASELERACAPCYALVQAQLLAVLNSTIHRSVDLSQMETIDNPVPITFDDLLGADASAAPIPLPVQNVNRSMAENRLIILSREILSDSSSITQSARKAFAQSFGHLLKAASRRTSLFDHGSCFNLCDFLEEAIAILARYYNDPEDPTSFLDWPFWLKVCKQMMESNNSMTEVRVYAFIYGLWGFISRNEKRKIDVCLDWLLAEDHFLRQFNHWCPMVRAYYMRLLCWRVARFDGTASEIDLNIFVTLSARLKRNWGYFLYVQEEAERNGQTAPSTAPCNPAPGRRLLIVRDDIDPMTGGVLLSFNGIVAAASASDPKAYERHSSLSALKSTASGMPSREKEPGRSSSPGKKRWGLLKTINPFSSSTEEIPKMTGPSTDQKANDDITSKQTTGDETTRETTKGSTSPRSKDPQQKPQSRPDHLRNQHSFKFSLEWVDRVANIPKERKPYPPRLPLPAQMYMASKRVEPQENRAVRPEGLAVGPSKYTGRALAEWTMLMIECQNFYERRKHEGVPGIKWVEIPVLGVESFRKPG